MMKSSRLIATLSLLVAGLSIPAAAIATEVDNTKLEYVRVSQTHLVIRTVNSPSGTKPCSNSHNEFAISLSDPAASEMARLAAAAFLAGRNVRVVGDEASCPAGRQKIGSIYLK